MLKNFLASITRNGLSIAGTALAIASIVLIISLFLMEQLGFRGWSIPRYPDVSDPADVFCHRADSDSDRCDSLSPQIEPSAW